MQASEGRGKVNDVLDLEGSDRGRVRGPRLSTADNDQDVPIDLCWAGSHHQPVCVCVRVRV